MQLVKAALAAILSAAIATGKEFDPVTTFVGVWTAINDQGVNTTLADLTLPTGNSATNIEVTTWSAVYYLTDGTPIVQGPICEFSQTGGDSPVVIAGVFLGDAAPATVLKGYYRLPTTVTLAVGGTVLSVVPRLSVPQGTTYGDFQWWNG